MSLPYFFEENINTVSDHFTLSEETSKHCVQVLRMKRGELMQLTNGKGDLFTASIIEDDKRNCVVYLTSEKFIQPLPRKVCVAISLLKNANRFEWFLEKATESGIHEITPLLCERTERTNFRFDRMRNILIAAMLQSRQAYLPFLNEPTNFNTVINSTNYSQRFIAYCGEGEKKNLNELEIEQNVQILIGPEGDFSEKEFQYALQQNCLPVSLGATRLRTETAGIVAATLLIHHP